MCLNETSDRMTRRMNTSFSRFLMLRKCSLLAFLLVFMQERTLSQQATSSRPTRRPAIDTSPIVSPPFQPTILYLSSRQTTFTNSSSVLTKGIYGQNFLRSDNATFLLEEEWVFFEGVIQGYTEKFAPSHYFPNVTTTCSVETQKRVDNQTYLEYSCVYQSNETDVSNFTKRYVEYVNANLTAFVSSLKRGGVNILRAYRVEEKITLAPTSQPTSLSPTPFKTFLPTQNNDPLPTSAPVAKVAIRRLTVWTIAAIVVSGGLSILAMLVCYYVSWKRKHLVLEDFTNDAPSFDGNDASQTPQRPNGIWPRHNNADDSNIQAVISPADSFMTTKSLISTGVADLEEDSGDEYDGTKDLQDEFDKYKDQNLEQFRDDVEGKVVGMEGVMSAAVTMAHMVDETTALDENGLRWGWDEKCSGTDIEASALYEVSDWLKRNENTPSERRRVFMEEILNRMVSSVKNGMLNADDGSRTIHEAAAILGLHLAEALPMATVVISGMRLTATANDLANALREFGDIDVAAVAPGSKGFGIVRFRRPKSVDRAMRRYNTGEIIIQDVAVQMKVLMATSLVDSRAPEIP